MKTTSLLPLSLGAASLRSIPAAKTPRLVQALGATCGLLLLMAAHAPGAIVRNLEFTLDGSLPSAEPDIDLFNSTGEPEEFIMAVFGGLLEQRTAGLGGAASYHFPNNPVTGGGIDPDLDVIMETRLRVWSIEARRGAFFEVFNGAFACSANFTNGGVVLRTADGGYSPVIPVTAGQFHTNRLEVRGGSGLVRFFVDGVLRFEGLAPVNTNLNGFCWGDGESGLGANVDWDYVRVWQEAPPEPRVTGVRAHCGAGTVTVRFNKAVALDGAYALDGGAAVLGQSHGTNAAEVVLFTTPLEARAGYVLTISGVHDLEVPAHVLVPEPTVWVVGCASGCGQLLSRPGANGAVVIEWNDAADGLQTSTDLMAWMDMPEATSPWPVAPALPAQYFRLRCDESAGDGGPAPVMIRHPGFFTVPAGTTVTFSGAAIGAGPLGHQWFFNGTNVSGGTNAALTLLNVSNANIGVYELRVTNAFGVTWSRPGYLLVPGSPGLPLNTTVALPPVSALLLDTESASRLPFNTTVAQPGVSAFLLRPTRPLPWNTTVAQPPVSAFLLRPMRPLPWNTTVAQPPLSVFLLRPIRLLPWNTAVAQPPLDVEWVAP